MHDIVCVFARASMCDRESSTVKVILIFASVTGVNKLP
jgi:hypothetical protein